jgi:2-hydroxycyclohexanecarboxyl-CoA dehydrogenase
MARLANKVAVVLGAATKDNMGQVIARFFAAEGAKVVVAGRHEETLKALATEIGGSWILCDITKKAEVEALCKKAVSDFGGVHIAVNATGWGLLAPLLTTTEEQLDQMYDLQFKGPYFFCQAFAKAMSDQFDATGRGGSVIQITSATATIMLDNHAAYMGTKAGADHVLRCFANEFGEKGIKFNSIAPGLTGTPMAADAMKIPGLTDAFLKEYPLGRIGTSEDIAHAAVWLASDESFVTGQTLQVNGGLTLRRNPRQAEISAAMAAAKRD